MQLTLLTGQILFAKLFLLAFDKPVSKWEPSSYFIICFRQMGFTCSDCQELYSNIL